MILVALDHVGEDRREPLLEALRLTLADVHAAVRDSGPMHALMRQAAADLTTSHAPFGTYGAEEYAQFLQWLGADRFIFLGARIYDYPRTAHGDYAAEEPVFEPKTCLGVLRDTELSVLRRASEPVMLTSQLARYLEQAEPLIVAKSTLKSRVHRRGYMDYVGVKRYDAHGRAVGEVRFVGLFTAEAYEDPARHLPLVRRKIEHVLARADANPSAHTGKRLRYHRGDLSPRRAVPDQRGRHSVRDRHRRAAPLRPAAGEACSARVSTPFDRFVSALLYIPAEPLRFRTSTRPGRGRCWRPPGAGTSRRPIPTTSDQPLARVCYYVIGRLPGGPPAGGQRARVEAEIAEAVRTWSDRFEAAARAGGVAPGLVGDILARYAHAFPPGYRDRYDAAEALLDLSVIEGHGRARTCASAPSASADDAPTRFRFKLYRGDVAVPLAEVLPVLENMGLKALVEEGFPIARTSSGDGPRPVTWVHEFVLEDARGEHLLFADVQVRRSRRPSWPPGRGRDRDRRLQPPGAGDRRLLARGGADPRARPLPPAERAGSQSQAVQEAALAAHPEIVRLILDLFQVKFDPAIHAALEDRAERGRGGVRARSWRPCRRWRAWTTTGCCAARALLVEALTRTNFYQAGEDGEPKPYISFKIASRRLEDLPAPKPFREIFVWAPHVEGVHLRFGPVARGGLRWSDRRDDFRTEVLGLVKAQQVKNAVIVPVGSKGGFYPKRLPAWRCGRRGAGRGRARLSHLPLRPARHHRQPGRRRRGGAAAERDRPRRRRSLPGGGGGQGHGHLLRHRQRRGGATTASGSATPSPPAARPATTTRSWASPPAAPGRRSKRHFREMGKDIAVRALHLHRRRRHERRRVRQRRPAVQGHEAGRRLRPPPHLPGPRSRSRDGLGGAQAACSTCPARPGTTTTRR